MKWKVLGRRFGERVYVRYLSLSLSLWLVPRSHSAYYTFGIWFVQRLRGARLRHFAALERDACQIVVAGDQRERERVATGCARECRSGGRFHPSRFTSRRGVSKLKQCNRHKAAIVNRAANKVENGRLSVYNDGKYSTRLSHESVLKSRKVEQAPFRGDSVRSALQLFISVESGSVFSFIVFVVVFLMLMGCDESWQV